MQIFEKITDHVYASKRIALLVCSNNGAHIAYTHREREKEKHIACEPPFPINAINLIAKSYNKFINFNNIGRIPTTEKKNLLGQYRWRQHLLAQFQSNPTVNTEHAVPSNERAEKKFGVYITAN